MRSVMLAPGFLFLASIGSLPSTEPTVRLPTSHHFLAVRIQRIVNNPLGRIDFVVVLKLQVAKSLRDGIQPRAFRLLPQRVVSVRAIHNLSKQCECRVARQIVFLQNRVERTFLSAVPQFHRGDVKRCGPSF